MLNATFKLAGLEVASRWNWMTKACSLVDTSICVNSCCIGYCPCVVLTSLPIAVHTPLEKAATEWNDGSRNTQGKGRSSKGNTTYRTPILDYATAPSRLRRLTPLTVTPNSFFTIRPAYRVSIASYHNPAPQEWS
jgi:hypothetical protein